MGERNLESPVDRDLQAVVEDGGSGVAGAVLQASVAVGSDSFGVAGAVLQASVAVEGDRRECDVASTKAVVADGSAHVPQALLPDHTREDHQTELSPLAQLEGLRPLSVARSGPTTMAHLRNPGRNCSPSLGERGRSPTPNDESHSFENLYVRWRRARQSDAELDEEDNNKSDDGTWHPIPRAHLGESSYVFEIMSNDVAKKRLEHTFAVEDLDVDYCRALILSINVVKQEHRSVTEGEVVEVSMADIVSCDCVSSGRGVEPVAMDAGSYQPGGSDCPCAGCVIGPSGKPNGVCIFTGQINETAAPVLQQSRSMLGPPRPGTLFGRMGPGPRAGILQQSHSVYGPLGSSTGLAPAADEPASSATIVLDASRPTALAKPQELDGDVGVQPLTAEVVKFIKSIGAERECEQHIKLIEGGDAGECHNINTKDFEEKELEIALDSGAVTHVCSDQTEGYASQETMASRSGANCVVGDGATIPNQGRKEINLASTEEGASSHVEGDIFKSVFQVTRVTRPLMSVSQICDNGHTVLFDKQNGVVRDLRNNVVCTFRRVGGLYIGKFSLKSPFGRLA